MGEPTDHISVVQQAKQGHEEACGALARMAADRLTEYVGRLTLEPDVTSEVVQETVTEMLDKLEELRDPRRFWSWLYTIALNRVRRHYGQRWRRRQKPLSGIDESWLQARERDVLTELVTRELRQIVVHAVHELEPRQRAVLTMRCYDQMSYRQISEVMGGTPLGARVLFHRAKKSMACLLNSHGIDRSALPVILLFFGKLSARSEAAAAGVSVTASTLQVGRWTPLIALAYQPIAAAVLAAAVLIGGAGALATRPQLHDEPRRGTIVATQAPPDQAVSQDTACWYYYPPETADVVMIRTSGRRVAYSQWLQNEQANYYRDGETIHIRNHRQFAPDLSVWRLPTDSPDLRRFLQRYDGRAVDLAPVRPGSRGLLVAVEQAGSDRRRQVTLRYDVSMEDYFRHDWSADAAVFDRRDEAHRRGWTHFTVSGRIGERVVSGRGRLPFVAAAIGDKGPWLALTFEDGTTLLDAGAAAEIRDPSGTALVRYQGGSFFQGLGRPWSGLHTIDTIRRDAARAGIPFVTRRLPDAERVEIALHAPEVRVVYRVQLYQDWIETIAFRADGANMGELTFSYPTSDETDLHRLTVRPSHGGRDRLRGRKGLWLVDLAQGSLVQ